MVLYRFIVHCVHMGLAKHVFGAILAEIHSVDNGMVRFIIQESLLTTEPPYNDDYLEPLLELL